MLNAKTGISLIYVPVGIHSNIMLHFFEGSGRTGIPAQLLIRRACPSILTGIFFFFFNTTTPATDEQSTLGTAIVMNLYFTGEFS